MIAHVNRILGSLQPCPAKTGPVPWTQTVPTAPDLRIAAQPVAIADYPPGATFGPRTLTSFEFVWILHGSAAWTWEGQRIELRPGEIVLIRPGMRDQFHWHPTTPSRHAYIHFRIDSGAEALGAQETWPLVHPLIAGEPLDALCRHLLTLSVGGARDPIRITAAAVGLMVTLFVLERPTEKAQSLPAPLVRALQFVRQSWSESGLRPISMEELAAGAAVSRAHLERLFRNWFGLGAIASLERLRLARAATLLLRTNLSVSEVADLSGFVSPFHFSRRFHKLYGTPPNKYRKLPWEDPTAPLGAATLHGVASWLWIDGDRRAPVGLTVGPPVANC